MSAKLSVRNLQGNGLNRVDGMEFGFANHIFRFLLGIRYAVRLIFELKRYGIGRVEISNRTSQVVYDLFALK